MPLKTLSLSQCVKNRNEVLRVIVSELNDSREGRQVYNCIPTLLHF